MQCPAQVARLVHGIGISKQKPATACAPRRRPNRIGLPCPAGLELARLKQRDPGKSTRNLSGPVG